MHEYILYIKFTRTAQAFVMARRINSEIQWRIDGDQVSLTAIKDLDTLVRLALLAGQIGVSPENIGAEVD